MFKHILIATDGSGLSENAALQTVNLAKSTGARRTALTASIPFHVFTSNYVMISDTEDVYNEEGRASARPCAEST